MDGMLSQEEINALLGGMGDSAENTSDVVANEPTPAAADSNERLSPEESDALGKLLTSAWVRRQQRCRFW